MANNLGLLMGSYNQARTDSAPPGRTAPVVRLGLTYGDANRGPWYPSERERERVQRKAERDRKKRERRQELRDAPDPWESMRGFLEPETGAGMGALLGTSMLPVAGEAIDIADIVAGIQDRDPWRIGFGGLGLLMPFVAGSTLRKLAQRGGRAADELPMDEASRMQRATDQGFDVETPVYHGTARPDRIEEVGGFDPDRATSGPSAFFTEDPEIASRYATNKLDTSRLLEGSGFNEMFEFDIGGGQTARLDNLWNNLDFKTRRTLRENLGRVTEDELGSSRAGDLVWGEGPGGKRHWEFTLQQSGGDPIKAAQDIWLNAGTLHGFEEKFLDVLEMAGLPRSMMRYDDPFLQTPGVVKAVLRKGKIFDAQGTTDESKKVLRVLIARLRKLSQERIPDAEVGGTDMWAKDTRYRTPGDWADALEADLDAGKNSYAWTSIPDEVSEEIRRMGYDTILDMGGKMGGQPSNVWIPLDPSGIRSPWAAFDPAKSGSANLLYGTGALLGTGAIRRERNGNQ